MRPQQHTHMWKSDQCEPIVGRGREKPDKQSVDWWSNVCDTAATVIHPVWLPGNVLTFHLVKEVFFFTGSKAQCNSFKVTKRKIETKNFGYSQKNCRFGRLWRIVWHLAARLQIITNRFNTQNLAWPRASKQEGGPRVARKTPRLLVSLSPVDNMITQHLQLISTCSIIW